MKQNFAIKKVLYILYLFVFTLIALEIILRFYNPFPFRLKGDKIVLSPNKKLVIKNDVNPYLEKEIIQTRNSLGFRGPEMPKDFDQLISIIAVGGSTTECFYLKDENTWPQRLQNKLREQYRDVWINNAGLEGHSTFGHQVLVNDYIKLLKPKFVLLLIGANDVSRKDLMSNESVSKNSPNNSFFGFLKRKSEVFNLFLNIKRYYFAEKLHAVDGWVELNKPEYVNYGAPYVDSLVNEERKLIPSFKNRMEGIVDTCLNNHITPILITQPSLLGEGTDSLTGSDLKKIKLYRNWNGETWWKMLELYNDATRKVAQEKGLLCIDLAHELPKNSLYFYDQNHYTNSGANKVSDIIDLHLNSYLRDKFPKYKK